MPVLRIKLSTVVKIKLKKNFGISWIKNSHFNQESHQSYVVLFQFAGKF